MMYSRRQKKIEDLYFIFLNFEIDKIGETRLLLLESQNFNLEEDLNHQRRRILRKSWNIDHILVRN